MNSVPALPARGATARLAGLILTFAAMAAAPTALRAAGAGEHAKVVEAGDLYDRWAQSQLAYHGIPGVAVGVADASGLAWARAYGTRDLASGEPLTTTTLFRIGSVSKLFTAVAILQLRDAGRLQLDDSIAQHLPWLRLTSPFATAPPITVEHLLTHTSGLPREIPFPAWTTHQFPSREELRAGLAGLAVVYPPGKSYKYSNLGMTLLGEIVIERSGKSYADYLREEILAPLGMSATTAAPTPAEIARLARQHGRKQPDGKRGTLDYYDTGAVAPAGAVVTHLEDLARFAAFLLSADPAGKARGGGQVLAAPTLAEMQRPRFVYPSWSGGRGLGFAVSRREGRTLVSHGGWIGAHRAELLLDPERQLAVVTLTNADDASPALFSRKALDLVGGALAAAKRPPAPPPASPDPAWQRFVGRYTDPWNWELEVLILDGGLALYEHDYPPEDDPQEAITRLTPLGPTSFLLPDGEKVTFELDEAGHVRRLHRRSDYLLPKRP